MGISTLAATALACVAMFQAERAPLDDAIFLTNGVSTRELFNTDDRVAGGGSSWFFTNAGLTGSVLYSGFGERNGRELWSSNGTTAGTRLLRDINFGPNFWSNPGGPSNPSSVPSGGTAVTTRFQKVGTRVVFPATNGAAGRELWASDGTATGTIMLRDHLPGAESGIDSRSGPDEFVFSNDVFAIYSVRDVVRGNSLWATNGTRAGTRHITSFNDNALPRPVGTVGNWILFGRENQSELWVTNGTEAGTRRIMTFGFRAIQNISRLKGSGYALMSVLTPNLGQELWITNGTTAGTRLLKNINLRDQDSSPGMGPWESGYFRVGNKVVFPATDDFNGRELWITNGTVGGTVPLANLTPGSAGSEFHSFALQGGNLYFSATVTEGGNRRTRPFVTNGTRLGTRKLSSTLVVDGRMVALRNGVVFPAYDSSSQRYLWRTGPNPNQQARIAGVVRRGPEHFQTVNIPTTGPHLPCLPQ